MGITKPGNKTQRNSNILRFYVVKADINQLFHVKLMLICTPMENTIQLRKEQIIHTPAQRLMIVFGIMLFFTGLVFLVSFAL